jgi:hypothetical protein
VTQENTIGDATKLYNATLNHLQKSPWNDTRNAKTLAWMVTGLIQTGSSNPPDWIPSIQTQAARAQSTERRFSRWLTNKYITAQHVYTPLITQALQEWGEYELRLALDTSLVFETHCIIRIVVLYRGRAVPLVQRVIAHASASVSFEQLEEVLNTAKAILRRVNRCKVIFLADRGFADTSLMQRLTDFGWSYRIRIKASFGIYSPDKQLLCKVGQIALEPGQAKYYQNVRLTAQHFGLVHVALARPEGVNELWAVVSDEPTSEQTFVEYGWRFQIEECFLDDKSGPSPSGAGVGPRQWSVQPRRFWVARRRISRAVVAGVGCDDVVAGIGRHAGRYEWFASYRGCALGAWIELFENWLALGSQSNHGWNSHF